MEKFIYRSKAYLKKNASTALTVVGSAGVVVTAVMAVKATPKALQLIEAAEKEKGEELTRIEKVRVAGMTYAPSVIVGAATIGCIFGANVLNKRTQAALTSAYALLDQTYKDYKNKAKELYGENGEREIRHEIAKDKYEECDIEVGDDAQLFYDFYSGQYFESTMEHVVKATYEINRKINVDSGAYLNDWYDELGIEQIESGYEFGWSSFGNMEMYWQPWVDFRIEKVELDYNLECQVITIMQEPYSDFLDY